MALWTTELSAKKRWHLSDKWSSVSSVSSGGSLGTDVVLGVLLPACASGSLACTRRICAALIAPSSWTRNCAPRISLLAYAHRAHRTFNVCAYLCLVSCVAYWRARRQRRAARIGRASCAFASCLSAAASPLLPLTCALILRIARCAAARIGIAAPCGARRAKSFYLWRRHALRCVDARRIVAARGTSAGDYL